MYDFNMFGTILSFSMKVRKHIGNNNPDRVKDYVCSAYCSVNPENPKSHPCWEAIKEGIDFLTQNGWKVGVGPWKAIGTQVIVVDPNNGYYHSNFQH